MTTWKALLLIYGRIDVAESTPPRLSFANELAQAEETDAVMSFQQFPDLVEELRDGRAKVEVAVERVERTLGSLTDRGEGLLWPSPDDTRAELDRLALPGALDSVFVFWPQNDLVRRRSIRSGGWGLGMGASDWSNRATYAAIGNAPAFAWHVPRIGEVWLHEWLHGVCAHFRALGDVMPEGDADGGGRHGYAQSATTGWMDFYRDLTNGRVREGERWTGIQAASWLLAGPRGNGNSIAA